MNAEEELESLLDRADELLKDLEKEYEKCLYYKEVSERAKNITHEVLEKLRNALDQTMWKVWDKYISPNIPDKYREHARVYFPITNSLNSFHSMLGRGWQNLEQRNKQLYDFLLNIQPFSSDENKWLHLLAEIAAKGKHVRLAPQKRRESRRTKVSRKGIGSVSWNQSSVRFSNGVSILGAPMDPKTQRTILTPDVNVQEEIWVFFTFEGYNVNAHWFCKEACQKTRILIENMVKLI